MASTFGIYMIVKNEEKYIKRGILSFLKCADEVVVVDTGSSDNTMKEIESIGDDRVKLYTMDWPFNFSIARNKAMSYTTSQFVLSMDGDEYFDDRLIDSFNRLKENDFYGCNYVNLNLENFSEGISYGIRHGERVIVSKEIKPQYRYCVHEKIYCEGEIRLYDMSCDEGIIIHTHDGNLWGGFDNYRQMYFNDINNIDSYNVPRTAHYQYYLHYTMAGIDNFLSLRALSDCYSSCANVKNEYDYRMELRDCDIISQNVFMALILTNITNKTFSDKSLLSQFYSRFDCQSDEFLIVSDYILKCINKMEDLTGLEGVVEKMFNTHCLTLYNNRRINEYITATNWFLKMYPDNHFAKHNSEWNEVYLIPRINETMVILVENQFTPSTLYYISNCFSNVILVNDGNSRKYNCQNLTIERSNTIDEAIEITKNKGYKHILIITPDKPIYVSEFSDIFNTWLTVNNTENQLFSVSDL